MRCGPKRGVLYSTDKGRTLWTLEGGHLATWNATSNGQTTTCTLTIPIASSACEESHLDLSTTLG